MPCAFARFLPFRSRAFFLSFSGLASTSDPARLSDSLLGGSARYRAFPNPFHIGAGAQPRFRRFASPCGFRRAFQHRTDIRARDRRAIRLAGGPRFPIAPRSGPGALLRRRASVIPHSPQSGERRFPFPGAAHRVPLFSCHTHVQFLRAFAAAPRSHIGKSAPPRRLFRLHRAAVPLCAAFAASPQFPHARGHSCIKNPLCVPRSLPFRCAALPRAPVADVLNPRRLPPICGDSARPRHAGAQSKAAHRFRRAGERWQCGRAGSARSDPHRWD